MENSSQDKTKPFKTLKISHLVSRKKRDKSLFFKAWEKRSISISFLFLPSPRIMFVFSLHYKNPPEHCKKAFFIFESFMSYITLLHTSFRLEAEVAACTEGSPRLCSGGSPGGCSADSIPFQHLQPRRSNPTFWRPAQSGPRLTFAEWRSRPNAAEFKFMFCWELFIGWII